MIARASDPAGYQGLAAGGRQPADGGPMWHYVGPRDLARAHRYALTAEDPDFGPYFISGPTTLAPDATVERLIDKMATSADMRAPEAYVKNAFAPVYDLSEAASGIGF